MPVDYSQKTWEQVLSEQRKDQASRAMQSTAEYHYVSGWIPKKRGRSLLIDGPFTSIDEAENTGRTKFKFGYKTHTFHTRDRREHTKAIKAEWLHEGDDVDITEASQKARHERRDS